MMGGIGQDFGNLEDIRKLMIPGEMVPGAGEDPNLVRNENGEYTIAGSGDELTITGVPSSGGDNIVLTIDRDANGIWTFDWDN